MTRAEGEQRVLRTPEIVVKPFFKELPIYLEASLVLKSDDFLIDSITFVPSGFGHDANVKIKGQDAYLVKDAVEFVKKTKKILGIEGDFTQEQVSELMSVLTAFAKNAKEGHPIHEI
ncbi:MAG: hypothetical protein M1450_05185 [Patescibacteria group bacterium]|nr:hypothetical protein [Patescibacteria group bacterium]